MNFLTPWVAGILAAIVIPALVLLYFLKLRRREQTIASTLLWKQAVEDLQVNAPFQRLRRNLLLLLQLLVLLAALLALARPIVETRAAEEDSIILLIDNSASMNTLGENGQTRLDEAKEQATRLVRTLNQRTADWFSLAGATPGTRVMVITFADRAAVAAPFTTNTSQIVDAIRAIEPTDGETQLEEALTLAQAYLTQPAVPDVVMETDASKVVLYTDGRIRDLEVLALRYGELEHTLIGAAAPNVGITTFSVRRNYERPEQLEIFAEVANFGRESVTGHLDLYIDDALVTSSPRLEVGPALPITPPPPEPGEAASATPLPEQAASPFSQANNRRSWQPLRPVLLDRAGVVELRWSQPDALATDNRAAAVLPPPRRLRVLVVGELDFFLESLLNGLPLGGVSSMSLNAYEASPEDVTTTGERSAYDVVVFNGVTTDELPYGNYIFLGAAPPVLGIEAVGEVPQANFLWYDDTHPVLRYVALEERIGAVNALRLELPETAEILAVDEEIPLVARVADEGWHILVVPFTLMQTNWVTEQSLPVFFYNAVRYLGSAGAIGDQVHYAPGETKAIQLAEGVATATVTRPDGATTDLTGNARGVAYFAGTEAAGLYTVAGAVENDQQFAVNLVSALESDIQPRSIDRLGAREVARGETIETATPEVWRWFVGAALVLLLVEWWVYNRRVFV